MSELKNWKNSTRKMKYESVNVKIDIKKERM